MVDLAKIPSSGSSDGLNQLLALLNTQALGSGKTTGSESVTTGGDADQQAKDLMAQILQGADPEQMKNLIDGINRSSKAAFGTNIMESIAAGNRVYSDTSLGAMQNDQISKAVQAAASAVLTAQQAANQQAVTLAATRVNNAPKTTVQNKQTGATPAANFTGVGLLALQGKKALEDMGILKTASKKTVAKGGIESMTAGGVSPEGQAAAINSSITDGSSFTPAPSDYSVPAGNSELFPQTDYINSVTNVGVDNPIGALFGLDVSNPTDILSSASDTVSNVVDSGASDLPVTDIIGQDVVGESAQPLVDEAVSDSSGSIGDWVDELFGGFADGGVVDARAPRAYIPTDSTQIQFPMLSAAPALQQPTSPVSSEPVAKTPVTGGQKRAALTLDENGVPTNGDDGSGASVSPGLAGDSSMASGPEGASMTSGQLSAILGFAVFPTAVSLANLAVAGITGKGITGNVVDLAKSAYNTLNTPAQTVPSAIAGAPSNVDEGMAQAGFNPNNTDDPIAGLIGFATGIQDANNPLGPEQTSAPVEDASPTPVGDIAAPSDGGVGSGDTAGGYGDGGSFGEAGDPGSGDTGFAANGGMISGPGTSKSDSIHIAVSDGEAVLNVGATRALGKAQIDYLNKLFEDVT